MALVKRELDIFGSHSDAWLSYWSNPDQEIKKENVKPNLSEIKIEDNYSKDIYHTDTESDQVKARSEAENRQTTNNLATRVQDSDSKRNEPCKSGSKRKWLNGRNLLSKGSKSWTEKTLENAVVSTTVANLCKYECEMCETVFSSSRAISGHFSTEKHNSSPKMASKSCLIVVIAYECMICSKRLLCDIDTIKSHLKTHNMTLKAYIRAGNIEYKSRMFIMNNDVVQLHKRLAKHGSTEAIGNLCISSCSKCSFSCKRWTLMTRHKNALGHGPVKAPLKCAKKVVFHKCQICSQLILCDLRILTNHLRTHKKTMTGYKSILNLPQGQNLHKSYLLELKALIRHISLVEPHLGFSSKPGTLEDS